jgi:hypothetical protein
MIHQEIPFSVPFYIINVNNWEQKKKLLLDLPDFSNESCYKSEQFTDYHNKDRAYLDEFMSILEEDIYKFIEISERNWSIDGVWCQRYWKDHMMGIHNHGPIGFSCILYTEFDKNVHEKTIFLQPFGTFDEGITVNYAPEIDEGDILIFPSVINHYVKPSMAEKQRTIFAWNMKENKND